MRYVKNTGRVMTMWLVIESYMFKGRYFHCFMMQWQNQSLKIAWQALHGGFCYFCPYFFRHALLIDAYPRSGKTIAQRYRGSFKCV